MSLTSSDGGVVFCGDDARLELFPTDVYGRAVPCHPSPSRGCLDRLELCRGRTAVDMIYAGVLVAICIVIVIILLVDQ